MVSQNNLARRMDWVAFEFLRESIMAQKIADGLVPFCGKKSVDPRKYRTPVGRVTEL
jgi:hypothetical protein